MELVVVQVSEACREYDQMGEEIVLDMSRSHRNTKAPAELVWEEILQCDRERTLSSLGFEGLNLSIISCALMLEIRMKNEINMKGLAQASIFSQIFSMVGKQKKNGDLPLNSSMAG